MANSVDFIFTGEVVATANAFQDLVSEDVFSADMIVQAGNSNAGVISIRPKGNSASLTLSAGQVFSASDFFRFGKERNLNLNDFEFTSSVAGDGITVAHSEVR